MQSSEMQEMCHSAPKPRDVLSQVLSNRLENPVKLFLDWKSRMPRSVVLFNLGCCNMPADLAIRYLSSRSCLVKHQDKDGVRSVTHLASVADLPDFVSNQAPFSMFDCLVQSHVGALDVDLYYLFSQEGSQLLDAVCFVTDDAYQHCVQAVYQIRERMHKEWGVRGLVRFRLRVSACMSQAWLISCDLSGDKYPLAVLEAEKPFGEVLDACSAA